MRRIVVFGVSGVVLCCLLYVYYSLFLYRENHSGVFTVSSGASVNGIGALLEKEGYINNALLFSTYVRVKNAVHKIRAGEYYIEKGSSMYDICALLIRGTMRMVQVTIPEGLPWWEVENRFVKAGIISSGGFTTLIQDREFLDSLEIPYTSLEGFLYPDTYTFAKPVATTTISAREVLRAMVEVFKKKTENIFPEYLDTKERYDVLILASIVEKEAKLQEEQSVIAGVYWNRLAKGMRLQADPTTIYGLGKLFDGNLRKIHLLDMQNPYNTYRNAGLPPTPICSPSVQVIKATLHPTKHSFLYFVATKLEGRHKFSTTLEEHNRAVRRYQLRQ